MTVQHHLEPLAARWPVGTPVRHRHGGWVGEVVEDQDPPGLAPHLPTAHCYVHAASGRTPGAVCVAWRVDSIQAVAWFRPEVLRRVHRRTGTNQ